MTTPDPHATWNLDVPDGWAEQVVAWDWHTWREEETKVGWRKWGPCARCGHTMAVYQRALRSISPARPVYARCNCTYDHDGRPASETGGCGVGAGAQKVAIPSAGNP
jgi:hypothetical protein